MPGTGSSYWDNSPEQQRRKLLLSWELMLEEGEWLQTSECWRNGSSVTVRKGGIKCCDRVSNFG